MASPWRRFESSIALAGMATEVILRRAKNAIVAVEPCDLAYCHSGPDPTLWPWKSHARAVQTAPEISRRSSEGIRDRIGVTMSYTLDQFSADCRAALQKSPGSAGRELVRQYTAR